MKLFELPRVLGTTQEGKEVKANIGRFGPYVQLIEPLLPFQRIVVSMHGRFSLMTR